MQSRKAFTLVELLVVIGIIALLISILLPVLAKATQRSRGVQCLSNLRQMVTSAHQYAGDHGGSLPIAYYSAREGNLIYGYNWDFTTITDLTTGVRTVQPGLLWQGANAPAVQQCPSFDGSSNTLADPYTGYNYNTSYLGHGQLEQIVAPMKISQIRRPSRCAIFGDGQWSRGADKFMRAPLDIPGVGDAGFSGRHAGTQGLRHDGKTNVAFADGHAAPTDQVYTAGNGNVVAGTGFLSADNSLYAPE